MGDAIKWDGSCSVRVKEFDEAHQHLFAIGNRLIRAAILDSSLDIVGDIVDELIE